MIAQGILKRLCYPFNFINFIWEKTSRQCEDIAEQYDFQIFESFEEVIEAADVTFACFTDVQDAKNIAFRSFDWKKKGLIGMTPMDPKNSISIRHLIEQQGGRYLEAPLLGSRIDANEGTLLVLAAGDESLYTDCLNCFDAISKKTIFIGNEVGTASKLASVNNMIAGTIYASVAEALAMVNEIGLEGERFLEILQDGGAINSRNIGDKAMAMINRDYQCNTSLKQVQRSFSFGLPVSDHLAQPTPIFAAANEAFKRGIHTEYEDADVSAVFEVTHTKKKSKD